MNRYEKRVIKLFKVMNNIMHWWNEYQVRLDNLLLESYPFNISYDEVVYEYIEIFGDILNGNNAYEIKETNVSRVDIMIFAELRDMCELINDFYKYDKERFLNDIPDCCDGDLLESVINWYNANVVKNKSTQQKIIEMH
jgi:hypothetical protein